MKSELETEIEVEIVRAKELLSMYESIPTGQFGGVVIKDAIKDGELSIDNQDVAEMIVALKKLRNLE